MHADQEEAVRALMEPDDGYVKELGYTHRYCAEIAPARIELACLAWGVSAPAAGSAPRYLELAFGQGVSINIHAAACRGEFQGIDFNPDHATNARDLAAASGSPARLSAESFEEFAARDDGPQFDVIAMHGTWSWISAANRHLVVEILRRRLAPGGLFFVSYNCLPGWASELPLRHLLTLHAQFAGPQSKGLAARIDASLGFAQSLLEADAQYFRAHGGVSAWLGKMHGQSRNYLAHEYFNRDWHPMPSSEVALALSAANLEFAASATLAGHHDGLGLPDKARELLEAARHPILRETVFDYLVNQRFRRDIFAKGKHRIAPAMRVERLRSTTFALLQHPDYVPDTADLPGGAMALPAEVYRPFVAAMAEDGYAPKTLRQLEHHPECADIAFGKLAEAALVLTGMGSLHPVHSQSAIDETAPRCRALNDRILERALLSKDISALACPVTGAGIFVAHREMLFLRAIALGHREADDWARYAWESLSQGDPVALRSDARAFARVRLPVLKALRVA